MNIPTKKSSKTKRKPSNTVPTVQNDARAPKPAASFVHREYVLEILRAMAAGDLACTVDVSRNPSDPILGQLQETITGLARIFGELAAASALVDGSSGSMNQTSKSLRDNAHRVRGTIADVVGSTEQMRQNMQSVAASTEELSVNMQSIATGARQSTENIDSIQVSIRELTMASKDIAENSARATTISTEAMANVTAAFGLVNELTAAAKQIDMVTSTISEISDQTKLLALNATIESARAGEMGKGFAVVAKEVKDLASQTYAATKDIQSKISIIHEVTRRTAAAITGINGVMKTVNESITSIAAAAEEQSVTTADIAKNVVDATERIREMTGSVGEGAVAVQDVSRSILGTTSLSGSVAQAIGQLGTVGAELEGDAVTSYAQALEILSHGGDMARQLRRVHLPDRFKAHADIGMGRLCRFSPDFDVMVDRLNNDHRRIFDYLNGFHQRIKDRENLAALVPGLKEFAVFVGGHFAREEDGMAAVDYPDLAAHRTEHEKLLKQVGSILADIEAGVEVDLIAVLGFCRGWLVTHILGTDRKYGPALAGTHIL